MRNSTIMLVIEICWYLLMFSIAFQFCILLLHKSIVCWKKPKQQQKNPKPNPVSLVLKSNCSVNVHQVVSKDEQLLIDPSVEGSTWGGGRRLSQGTRAFCSNSYVNGLDGGEGGGLPACFLVGGGKGNALFWRCCTSSQEQIMKPFVPPSKDLRFNRNGRAAATLATRAWRKEWGQLPKEGWPRLEMSKLYW